MKNANQDQPVSSSEIVLNMEFYALTCESGSTSVCIHQCAWEAQLSNEVQSFH